MVEFGLKLEDNKVEEWSDQYIDYEKLKALIKRAKKSSDARDALSQKKPEIATEVRVAYDAGLDPRKFVKQGSFSDPHLNRMAAWPASAKENDDGEGDGDADDDGDGGSGSVNNNDEYGSGGREACCGGLLGRSAAGMKSNEAALVGLELPTSSDARRGAGGVNVRNVEESMRLLGSKHGSERRYGAQAEEGCCHVDVDGEDDDAITRSESAVSLSGAFQMIKGYFRGNFVLRLYDSIAETDKRLDRLSKCIYEELEKVNCFYDGKTNELQQRLDVLVESVGLREPKEKKASALDRKPNRGHGRRLSLSDREGIARLTNEVRRRLHSVIPSFPSQEEEEEEEANLLQEKASAVRFGDDYLSDDEVEKGKATDAHDAKEHAKEADSVKRELIDLHRRTTLLLNFSIMNYTGFVKIIKKFDKTFPEKKGRFADVLKKDNICREGKDAEQLISKMEKLYAKWFCDHNIREARAQMLPKHGDALSMDWSQLRLGYRLGMCSILALWVCWDCIWGLVADGNTTIGGRTAFPVFRACGGLLLLHWFWGASVYVWTRYRINYIFLFDFNPRVVDTPMNVFDETVDETLVFFSCMLLYYKSGAHDMPEMIPAGGYPFLLVLFTAKKLIFPWRTRAPMWRAIWEVITAPLYSPKFFHTYIGDIFTSMVKVFQDILWTLCFVFSGDFLTVENLKDDTSPHMWQHAFWYKNVVVPLICLFPLWTRFNQCLRRYMDTGKRWPNLANAFKYAMSQTVTLFGAFHPLYLLHVSEEQKYDADNEIVLESNSLFQIFWMGLFVSSSLYSFLWDVYMDWGLGKPQFGFLGPRLMFPKRIHYYGVIVIDLVLRFMWVLTLIPPQSGASFELPQYLTALTMSLELMRRTLWGFFRLEHEHRHNTEGYRRVDFVPLHFSTGHANKHKKKDKERVGWQVLAEVFTVSLIVIAVSVTSVIAAQRATRQTKAEL